LLLRTVERCAEVELPSETAELASVPGNGGEAKRARRASFSQILGCELTGAKLVVTAQFTGCVFCWTEKDDVAWAAHIGPTKPASTDSKLDTTYRNDRNAGFRLAQDLAGQAKDDQAGMANVSGGS
jgi:hypothetical protein